jgi:hypothetical protein
MGFIPKKWLRQLWGVSEPPTRLERPIDCRSCHRARKLGYDACQVHHELARTRPRPHLYHAAQPPPWAARTNGTDW